jgi:hypothetical protein
MGAVNQRLGSASTDTQEELWQITLSSQTKEEGD